MLKTSAVEDYQIELLFERISVIPSVLWYYWWICVQLVITLLDSVGWATGRAARPQTSSTSSSPNSSSVRDRGRFNGRRHSYSGRRGPWEGLGGPCLGGPGSKFWLAIAKSWLQLEL